MTIGICSVLGVLLAFSGLAVFLVSLIALLPVNIYNAIRSCLVLKHAIAISDQDVAPAVFLSGTILVALVSLGLFMVMTHKSKGKTERQESTYGSTTNSGANNNNSKNSNTKPSVLAKHKHRVVNIYSISYVVIDVIWVAAGILLLHSMSKSQDSSQVVDEKIVESVKRVIGSQIYITGVNLIVIASSVGAMAVSSIFFYLGKNKSGSSKPYYNIV
ncbi:hypothetical protein V8B55DRAFT_1389831 [Mucor lusitanicus]|uniref:Uncharacterized protein n=2 Tax=Mucor circinelloides f. lusitanicus TaxID=29924 RepID=A0A168IWA2_MUCCL|nr:hypothetical protein FB192DRAFT_1344070 [Mucor lusitanicus]OAD00436.1 hypothetical protein MUCCIDRAFT_157058 [Mucor lusitanicus CBS 277.49]